MDGNLFLFAASQREQAAAIGPENSSWTHQPKAFEIIFDHRAYLVAEQTGESIRRGPASRPAAYDDAVALGADPEISIVVGIKGAGIIRGHAVRDIVGLSRFAVENDDASSFHAGVNIAVLIFGKSVSAERTGNFVHGAFRQVAEEGERRP